MRDRPGTFAATVILPAWQGVDGVDRGPVSLPVLMGDPGAVIIAPTVRRGQVVVPPRDLAFDVLVPADAVQAYDPRIVGYEVRVPVGADHVAGRKRYAVDRATGRPTTYFVDADVDVDDASAADLLGDLAAVVGLPAIDRRDDPQVQELVALYRAAEANPINRRKRVTREMMGREARPRGVSEGTIKQRLSDAGMTMDAIRGYSRRP